MAKAKGLYAARGLDVTIVSPHSGAWWEQPLHCYCFQRHVAAAGGSARHLPSPACLPAADGYKATPASRVESGEALFAIAPSGAPPPCHCRSFCRMLHAPHWTPHCMRPKGCALIPSASLLRLQTAESVISYNTWPAEHKARPKLRAVAAVLQQDTSAIVTLKSSGIDRPAKVGHGARGSLAAGGPWFRAGHDGSRSSVAHGEA